MDGMLPPPDRILILDKPPEEVRAMEGMRLTYGLARRDEMSIWFRDEPPDPFIYAHELAHLTNANIAPRIVKLFEEIYADSIARIALVFVKRNIKPPTNPARLFEKISLKDIADSMRKYFKLKGEDKEIIEQYYEIKGIMPVFADVRICDYDEECGFKVKIEYNYPHEILTLYVLSSLVSTVSITESPSKSKACKAPELSIILDLLNKLAGKEENDLLRTGTRRKKKTASTNNNEDSQSLSILHAYSSASEFSVV
jgi:hypothetical protein